MGQSDYFLGIEVHHLTAGLLLTRSKYIDDHLVKQIWQIAMYLSLTRPDVSYAVHRVSQFLHEPTENHWSACKCIMRYLKHNQHYGLFLRQSSTPHLSAYADADWASNPEDRKSVSGYAIYLGTNLVYWSTRKQPTVARSSTEAEYRSVGAATTELVWLKSLLQDIGFSSSSCSTLWCDNVRATKLASNPVFHSRTKHIEVEFHFVRDLVSKRLGSIHCI
ncbi:secreted RxLR effector protein 161-like [Hevea brasiliensis]|uniref:secreted RxLR effector protein 161-like n=1 Tax=Hevea brasiliensis TaxID=3981 RepID=UPI0025FD4003|nr:secreted RxLR effector protein 161-like [Hevea brasiliensis]